MLLSPLTFDKDSKMTYRQEWSTTFLRTLGERGFDFLLLAIKIQ